ncbi:hypothetical protein TSTA_085380 [Talaromyces stipitatus ATCC 10500]|uniref:Catalase core domain-containing protein n=1 Tax=Talaromyces stipitatus (strain ATCC 10500 / CBS 375.48 / QM 6759 / NRRL 1006) TaxID=441959 RepID=B8M0L0_TALSN|nr:uncharacterized protein TSTA_085380 [Talaromyces stipitatus ATCC 10500]EED21307.1 hypothetical protein TSTA_085380 [Talaromyces stipitatus ATCC 10500]
MKSVFFCRDPIQGPDVIRSQYRNPQNFLLDQDSLNTREDKRAGMMFFCDYGTPRRLEEHARLWLPYLQVVKSRTSTYSTPQPIRNRVNENGEFVYITPLHRRTRARNNSLRTKPPSLSGEDPDYPQRDL